MMGRLWGGFVEGVWGGRLVFGMRGDGRGVLGWYVLEMLVVVESWLW